MNKIIIVCVAVSLLLVLLLGCTQSQTKFNFNPVKTSAEDKCFDSAKADFMTACNLANVQDCELTWVSMKTYYDTKLKVCLKEGN